MKKFWQKYQDRIKQEFIKSIFILIVAIIAVTYLEKSKIHNEISFSKKIDIFSSEREKLLENSERFTEHYGDFSQFVSDNINSDFKSNYTYKSNVTKMKRLLLKTDLILINSMIDNDSLKIFHQQMNSEGHAFISELETTGLDNLRFALISTLFDKITGIYGKEITKEIK